MARSDNYPYTGKVTYVCSGSGTINVVVGFPVTSAMVTFATLPLEIEVPPTFSSSSTSSFDSSSSSDNSNSTSSDNPPIKDLPRIYVSSYLSTGFVVTYEGIPEDVGYIEFTYIAS